MDNGYDNENIVRYTHGNDNRNKYKERTKLISDKNESQKKLLKIKKDYNELINNKKDLKNKLNEMKNDWNNERKNIISKFGDIPIEISKYDEYQSNVDELKSRNTNLKATLTIIEEHWTKKLKKIENQLRMQKNITSQTHTHNKELSKRVDELKQEKKYLLNELNKNKYNENNNNNNNESENKNNNNSNNNNDNNDDNGCFNASIN